MNFTDSDGEEIDPGFGEITIPKPFVENSDKNDLQESDVLINLLQGEGLDSK